MTASRSAQMKASTCTPSIHRCVLLRHPHPRHRRSSIQRRRHICRLWHRAFAKTRSLLSLRKGIRANRCRSGPGQDQANGIALPCSAVLAVEWGFVETGRDLPQRQAAGVGLLHQPDHVLLCRVFRQAVVLIVIAEGKLAGMGCGCGRSWRRRTASRRPAPWIGSPPSTKQSGGRTDAGRRRAGQGRCSGRSNRVERSSYWLRPSGALFIFAPSIRYSPYYCMYRSIAFPLALYYDFIVAEVRFEWGS